jgi:acetylglutamate synthase
MNRMRKCNDEVYQLAKDQALVKTLCRRGTHWKTLADPKFISLTTIQVGKKIKDRKKRVFGSASYKHYTRLSRDHQLS